MGIINLARRDSQPYTQIPNQAIRDPRLTPTAFRLLAYLMSHTDGYELNYEQIEAQTGLGRYAINEGSKLLVELKWIAVERPKINGRFANKTWVVLEQNADESIAGHSTMESRHMGQPTDIRKTIIKEKQLQEKQVINTLFDDFWISYPRKVQKEAARKAFASACKRVDPETVIAGCRAFARSSLPAEKFIPYPASWLNAGGYADEYEISVMKMTSEELEAKFAYLYEGNEDEHN